MFFKVFLWLESKIDRVSLLLTFIKASLFQLHCFKGLSLNLHEFFKVFLTIGEKD